MSATRATARPERITLGSAREGRLLYGQVHEDPRLELDCLTEVLGEPIVVVSSGGCTALSMLAAGAADLRAVDSSESQNHVVELKLAALASPQADDVAGFIGAQPMSSAERLRILASIQPALPDRSRAYWSAHQGSVAAGLLGAGVSERFMHFVAGIMRLAVHPPERVARLLACSTLDQQRMLYDTEWNSRRWRAMFKVLLGRRALTAAHETAMFRNVANSSFAEHFRSRFEHTVTTLPVGDNYFLHYALTDRYPSNPAAQPPYLAPGARAMFEDANERVTLVDAGLTEYLGTLPDQSLGGYSLSNICEWLDMKGIDALFSEISRTARPGAVVCFRNFVGWTEVPERWRESIVEDRVRGTELLARDRALVNRRFAVCRAVASS